MALFAILFSALAPVLSQGVPTPPAPPPPTVAADAQIRSLLDRSTACVNGDSDAANAADKATKELQAPTGSSEWIAAKNIVGLFVQKREEGRLCIKALEGQRYSLRMTVEDHKVVVRTIKELDQYWLKQGPLEIDVLARLLFIKTDARDIPDIYWGPSSCDR